QSNRPTDRRCPAIVLSPVTHHRFHFSFSSRLCFLVVVVVLLLLLLLVLCVRACRPVFVIPGSMSSIKIYLSDFS
ncbi:hypothetical protein KR200_008475, partial [Drosophila serrata]